MPHRHAGAAVVFEGHAFADGSLLAQALTHRSAGSPHNERLEFLGDALLNLIIAEQLYLRWPKADEGAMTRARAELVRESALAEVARTLELGTRLTLGPGEMKTGGHRRDSILADALEAIIAALYLDGGFDACRNIVLAWFEPLLAALPPLHQVGKDAKTRLQEWLQARQLPLPVYTLAEESGDDHDRRFRVACTLGEPEISSEGNGTSRRGAEQAAAEAALAQLPQRPVK
ncbi:ribonuclease III [Cognatiluteimonas telluris]|uniref:ribonuclease III n=1 Tax=Cognatiluteimonas telluris TaxID=1104775 RepID=UPI0014089DB7|nr:ribonuclease III [Lysobacter telluris]